MMDDLRKNASDKERWKSFFLNNSDNDSNALKIVLIKSVGFAMRLDPKNDYLYFKKPGMEQIFAIHGPSDRDDACQNYSIYVISASAKHAVIRQSCYSHDAAPGWVRGSDVYYLYDAKTATMTDFWRSGTELKKCRFLLSDRIQS